MRSDRRKELNHRKVKVFNDPQYDKAIMGVTHDNRAIYDYENMIDIRFLLANKNDNEITYEQVKELVDESISSLNPKEEGTPIICYPIEY